MRRQRRHAPPLRARVIGSARVTVSIALGLILLGGGLVFAAYRYDKSTSDQLLPGTHIGGVDVSELTASQASAALEDAAAGRLHRPITITVGEKSWEVTPAELGASAHIDTAVVEAMDRNGDYSWPDRVYQRLLDRRVGGETELEFTYDRKRIGRFVKTIAAEVEISPTNAAVEMVDGELVLKKPEFGQRLRTKSARNLVMEAVQGGASASVELKVTRVEPEVTKKNLGQTIVVDLSELKLYFYEGLKLQKKYNVAAGQPQYPTPPGEWNVVNKAENPTWTNPDPQGWGAGMPLQIPGGPGNPLGTRAIYLDAPGIRIHGTSATSSIGTYASHGCVRMVREDVEELYGLVDVGAKVHIIA